MWNSPLQLADSQMNVSSLIASVSTLSELSFFKAQGSLEGPQGARRSVHPRTTPPRTRTVHVYLGPAQQALASLARIATIGQGRLFQITYSTWWTSDRTNRRTWLNSNLFIPNHLFHCRHAEQVRPSDPNVLQIVSRLAWALIDRYGQVRTG